MAVLDEAEPPLKNRRELTRHYIRSTDGVDIRNDALLGGEESIVAAEELVPCVSVLQHSEQEVDVVPRLILRDDPGYTSRARPTIEQSSRVWLIPKAVVPVQQPLKLLARFGFQDAGDAGFRSEHTSRHDWHQHTARHRDQEDNGTGPPDCHTPRLRSVRRCPPSPAHVTGVSLNNHLRPPTYQPLRKPLSLLPALRSTPVDRRHRRTPHSQNLWPLAHARPV